MLTRLEQARQEGRANFYRLNVPTKFPKPRFNLGDLVHTDEGDDGEMSV